MISSFSRCLTYGITLFLLIDWETFCRGIDVLLLNTGFGDGEVQTKIKELLHVEMLPETDNSGNMQ